MDLGNIVMGTNGVYGENKLDHFFGALEDMDGVPADAFTFTAPDIRAEIDAQLAAIGSAFSLLGLLNDPGYILDGVDDALGTVQDVFSDAFDVELPFVGDKLAGMATFIQDMRQGVLKQLRDKLEANGGAIPVMQEVLYDVFGPVV